MPLEELKQGEKRVDLDTASKKNRIMYHVYNIYIN